MRICLGLRHLRQSKAVSINSLLNSGDFYIAAAAQGTGDGLSDANAMSPTSANALTGAQLSGKTVIFTGTSTITGLVLTFTGNASPVTFLPRDPSSPVPIDQLGLNGVGDCTFRQCKMVDSAWSSTSGTSGAAIVPQGACGNITLDRCIIKGNYRGDINASFDVLSELPEYACVAATVNGSGTVTALSVPHRYVGDLLSPGTYSLVMTDTNGTGFAGTFTVSLTTVNGVTGNFIDPTPTLTSGGSGYLTTSHPATYLTWTGQHRFKDYAPWGMRYFDGSTTVASLTATGCTLSDLGEGFKSIPPANTLTITGNTVQRVYGSGFSIGMAGATVPPTSTVINFNFFDQCGFYDSFDAGNPHGDAVHLFLNDNSVPNTPSDWGGIEITGNVILGHDARGCDIGFLIGQHPSSGVTFDAPDIVGNLMVGDVAASFIDFDTLRDGYIVGNTGIRFNTSNPLNTTTLAISIPSTSTSTLAFGKSLVSKNISGAITLPNTSGKVVDAGDNSSTGLNGASIPYSTIFADPNGTRNSVATALAAYTAIGIYAGRGANGITGWIDYTNHVRDRTKEPTFVNFDGLTGQTPSTAVNSAWCRVRGGPASQNWSVAGGTAQVADDALGTNATAAAASGTVARGKYMRVNQTTSATGSTTTTATLTINGYSYGFSARTQAVLSFSTVDNQVTAYSTMPTPSPNETGNVRFLIGVGFKNDVVVSGAQVFADDALVTRLFLASASAYRFQLTSLGVIHKSNLAPTTGWETHLMAVDFTKTAPADVSRWYADQGSGYSNVVQATGSTAGDGTGTQTRSTTQLFAHTLGMLAKPDGTLILNGELAFFFMHWGDATFTLPDIGTSAVQDKFSADQINLTDGSGVLGFKPKLFFTGAASAWNAGLANKGTEALTMTKGAGTYA